MVVAAGIFWFSRQIFRRDDEIRRDLLGLCRELALPPRIEPIQPEVEVVHSEEFVPEAELDLWMNTDQIPKVAGWGPTSADLGFGPTMPTPDEYPEP